MSVQSPQKEASQDWGPFRLGMGEVGGAFGDLGTFLPLVIGVIAIGGLSPVGVLVGFGLCYLFTGIVYRLPIPVQPMKAVAALIMTAGLTPGAVVASGMVIGVVLIVLAVTGAIERLVRWIPASVVSGLQLGIGASLAWLGLGQIVEFPWFGGTMLGLLLLLMWIPRCPAALVVVVLATAVAPMLGLTTVPSGLVLGVTLPSVVVPSLGDLVEGIEYAVLPQLPLTVTNAVIVTAALAHTLFPDVGRRAGERKLALTSGIASLLLAPFGALPMCHGAGGLAAHHRFGARTGTTPVLLGAICLCVGLFLADSAIALLMMIPTAAVGSLLVVAGVELGFSRRLLDARPSCRPVIAVAAVATVLMNPAIGLLAGWAVEIVRAAILRVRTRTHAAGVD